MADHNVNTIGRRLMPQVIDHLAELDPERRVCLMPQDADGISTFIPLSISQVAHGVHYMAHWIIANFGPPIQSPDSRSETLAYLGANDIRYLVVVMACNKTGYQPLLSSTRNSQAAQVRLLELTKCSKLAYSSERRQKAAEIEAAGKEVQSLEIPSWGEILAAQTTQYPFSKTFDQVTNNVAFIAHSSGTTGFPKPIPLTFGYFGALDYNAYTPIPDDRITGVPDRLSPSDLIIATPPFFHLMGFSLLIMSVFHGIPCVILPDKPLSSALLTTAMNSTQPTAGLFPSSILEDLSTSPEAMQALSRLKYVYFGAGPLAPETGNKISKHTPLLSFLGLTEGGFVTSLVPQDREDWAYFEWASTFGITMEPLGEENGVAEMVLDRHENPVQQPIFHTFPDLDRYHTQDLYAPHPVKKGLWKFHGRLDDVIVFSNGEKFNPVSMEKMVEGHPLVRRVVGVGTGRFESALLLEPNWEIWEEGWTEDSFVDEIWPVVREANRITVAHGRIVKSRIGLASREKPFSTTPKGSTQRRLVVSSYKEEIEAIYARDRWREGTELLTKDADLDVLARELHGILSDMLLDVPDLQDQTDFYQIGFDSLQTLQLCALLQKSGFESITPQTVYDHSTVQMLSVLLHNLSVGITTNGVSRSEKISALVKKYTDDLPTRVGSKDHHVVLLTGSTGSLGTYILNALIQDSKTSKVYCLNRSAGAPERQSQSFQQKGLSFANHKIEFIQARLGAERLGLAAEKYYEMLSQVDTVIHNAWRMDFNLSVDSYEDQIQAVRRLIDFSMLTTRRAHFYFHSSIGAVGEWKPTAHGSDETIPEAVIESGDAPLYQGYGEAKHICERICHAASEKAGVPATILRLGQIAGPTTSTGLWNSTEWLPAIIATSKAIGKIPRTLGSAVVDWVPVDTLATAILELVSSRRETEGESPCSVFHLVNPVAVPWDTILPAIHDHYAVRRVSMQEWIAELESIEGPSAEQLASMPALKLLPFYRGLVKARGALSVPMCAEGTKEASPTMRSLDPISAGLMGNWLTQWGF